MMLRKRFFTGVKARYIATVVLFLFTSSSQAFGLDQSAFPLNDVLFYGQVKCTPSEVTSPSANDTREYSNPMFSGIGQGPTAIQGDDGTYHVYLTSRTEKPLKHLTSNDLTTWRESDRQTISNLGDLPTRSLWAPGIAKTGDHYTLVFAGIEGRAGFIGYAISDNAGGPFTYKGELKSSSDRARILDPSLYVEGNGIYITFGSSPITIAKLNMGSDGTLTMRDERTLLERGDRDGSGFPFTIEQPWIQKIDGWYYLFYSAGDFKHTEIGTANEYSVRVARSRSLNDRFNSNNHSHVVIEGERASGTFRAPGASSIIQDAEGQYWMFYNAYKPPYGKEDRRLMLDKLEIENGWPIASDGYPSSRSEAPIPGDPPEDTASPPNACACPDPSAPSNSGLRPGDAKGIYNYFLNKDEDIKPIHAAGIVGNAAVESAGTYHPQVFGGGGNRYRGIFQWGLVDQAPEQTGKAENNFQLSNDDSPPTMRGDRWGNLVTWAGEQNLNPFTLDAQLGFAWHESTTSADSYDIEDLKETTSEGAAAVHWGRYFERAITNGALQAEEERIRAAELALEEYGEGSPSGSGGTTSDSSTTQDCGDGGGLVSGGMSKSDAERFMDTYSNSSDSVDYIGPSWRNCSGGPLSNCVSFSAYFVNKYTTLGGMLNGGPNGDGGAWVDTLLSRNPNVESGNIPKPYSVFSTWNSGGDAGHTGIVLGVDTERGVVITGEASCSSASTGGYVGEYTIEEVSIDDTRDGYKFAYVEEFLKDSL